jgi:transcriptional regulator with XRE-family HTH domain
MEDAAALQSRLTQFATSHTRAEIARKTGTSVMNVGRYLKGTRVPAEFCMALVREFGVNANWLLAGQGGPFVSDLATQHGQMAGNLLELVEAMSAVAKMRLGSIAGQQHMKLLRQLNDSLGTYERLREKLNVQSRGILADVLRELQGALTAMDMARSGALRKAAEQVARLCDDAELASRLLALQAHHAYLAGRMDESLQLLRKRFVQSISDGRITSDEQAQGALRLVIVLHDSGRGSDALRVGRSFLALAGEEASRLPSIAGLGTFCGHIHSLQGNVPQALELLNHWLPFQEGRNRAVSQAGLVRAQLLGGLLTFEEALAAPGLEQPKQAHILTLACAVEDPVAIRACMRFLDSPEGREVKERTLVPRYGPLLARAIERADKATLRESAARARDSAGHPRQELEWMIYETQLLRLVGERAKAARQCAKVEQAILKLEDPGSLDVALRVQHWRNRVLLGHEPGDARRQLGRCVAAGCRLFKPLLD